MDIRNFFKAAAAPTAKKKNAAAAAEAKVGQDAHARGDLDQLEEKKKKRNEEQGLEDDATMEVAPVAKKAKKVRNVLAVKRQREGEAVASEATTETTAPLPKEASPLSPEKKLKSKTTTTKKKELTPKELRAAALKRLSAAIASLPEKPNKFTLREQTSDLNPYNQKGGEEENPPNRGTKDAPPQSSDENLLSGLTFVITGTLDSLLREECTDLIKRHGGRVTTSVSGKTDFLVCGLDSGGSKVRGATERKDTCRMVDEDGLFALIASGPPAAKASASDSSPRTAEGARPAASATPPSPSSTSTPTPTDGALWVTKHRPCQLSEVVGNQMNVKLISSWLRNFRDVHVLHKPARGSAPGNKKAEELLQKKAVLLSGPPGVGKTTCAVLVAKSLGFGPIIEVNASDARGKSDGDRKKGLNGKGSNQIRELLNNRAMGKAGHRGAILVMDECDGMSGSDRGGIAEIVDSIKRTKIPIICICNDKYLQKMKPLRNACVELDFRKPTKEAVAKRMLQVCEKEGLKANKVALETLAERSNGDLRILLGHLQQWRLTRDSLTYDDVRGGANALDKDADISPFKVCDALLGPEGKRLTIADQVNLCFQDMDLIPLLVQENYVNHRPLVSGNEHQRMKVVAKAAEGITYGDWASEVVRGQGEWGLMPYQAVMAAVYPATYCRGQRETMGLYPNEMNITRFSAWLGKNSSRGKVERELTAVGMGADCLPLVRRRMVDPLVANGKDGIPEVLAFMDSYNLTKEDREAIFDTLRLNKKEDLLKKVPTAVKSALTRALTKAGNVRDWEPPKPSKAKSKPKAKAKGKGKAKKK